MAARWTVVRQEQRDELEGGAFVPHIIVYFRMDGRVQDYNVKVPVAQYTPDRVRELIDQYADSLDKVFKL